MTNVESVMALSQSQVMPSLRCHPDRGRERLRGLRVDPLLDDVAEMADQSLHRPGRGIAECADGMALHLIAHVEQHIDLALLGLALGHALEHPPHPACALAAGRALPAGFMLVEV